MQLEAMNADDLVQRFTVLCGADNVVYTVPHHRFVPMSHRKVLIAIGGRYIPQIEQAIASGSMEPGLPLVEDVLQGLHPDISAMILSALAEPRTYRIPEGHSFFIDVNNEGIATACKIVDANTGTILLSYDTAPSSQIVTSTPSAYGPLQGHIQ